MWGKILIKALENNFENAVIAASSKNVPIVKEAEQNSKLMFNQMSFS